MNKSFYRICLILFTVIIVTTSVFAKVPRRMLMEDHTGAWCGWCVMGNQAMEEMIMKYPDNFIPVAVHNGDGMVTPYQAQIIGKITIPGYPSGMMNRMVVTANGETGVPVHPLYWPGLVEEHLNDMSIVDVNVTYSIDKTTKTLTAKVTATMTEDYNGQLAFNLYIMEDDLSGTGDDWDQSNYLSGNADYQDSPYFSLPNPVTGFLHQNVMIDMLGGAFGMNGSFPAKAVSGTTYEQSYTVDLAKYKIIQDLDKIWVVGLVQETGSKYEILNAKSAGKVLPKPKYVLTTSQTDSYLIGKKGTNVENDIVFTNPSNKELVVDFTIDPEKSNIPSDWIVGLNNSTATMPANSSITTKLSITPGNTSAYSNIVVKANVRSTEEYSGLATKVTFGVLTEGVDYAVYHFNDASLVPLQEALDALPDIKNKAAIIPLNDQTVLAFKNAGFKVAIIPESFSSAGMMINNTTFLSLATSMMLKSKAVLMTSVVDMFFVAGNDAVLKPDGGTTTYFMSQMGISGPKQTKPYIIGSSSTGYKTKGLKGVDSAFTKDMSFNINEYDAAEFPYGSYYADQISIINAKNVSPILLYDDNTLPEANKIAAVKIQTVISKNIYMGFSFDLIANKVTRTTLLGNMIGWLAGLTDVEEFNNLNYSNIQVYPNPVTNNSTVSFTSSNVVKSSDVYLVDINGNRVATLSNSVFDNGTNTLNLDASNIASGKYYVITNLDGKYSMFPVVIQK
jgi:hypothetical protein